MATENMLSRPKNSCYTPTYKQTIETLNRKKPFSLATAVAATLY